MATVMVRCPTTGRAVSTEIETELSIFQKLPEVPSRLQCPLCGQEHVWTAREVWLAEAGSNVRTGTEG